MTGVDIDSGPRAILTAARRYAHATARRLTVDALLGEDGIESAANLAAAHSIARWDPAHGGTFDGYLAVTIRRQLIDDIRSRYGYKRYRRRPALVSLRSDRDEAAAEHDWASTDVKAFLESLAPSDRWIVECRAAGYDTTTIGTRLGISASGVSQRLRVVRRSWRCFAGVAA